MRRGVTVLIILVLLMPLVIAPPPEPELYDEEESYIDPYSEEFDYYQDIPEEQLYDDPVYEEPVYEEPMYQEPVYNPPSQVGGTGNTVELETKVNELEAELEQYKNALSQQSVSKGTLPPFWMILASGLAIIQFLLIIGFLLYHFLQKDETPQALVDYVSQSKAKGYSHDQIKDALSQGGYDQSQIDKVMEQFGA